ncbi:MAG TPA: PadR family transcriptional regulator [Solirubrobacteraceae bacterium]|nr:PadR family transcriptional regulator [Solirubrobacteraceae bacterium]
MSAKHALLGLLLHRPAYRYQLGERLQERIGPAWKINSGQLYQTVKQLAADGLIERIDGAPDDQDKLHVYAITVAGAEAFERWFDGAVSTARLSRRPLLVKITLAGPERLKDTLQEIDGYEHHCMAALKTHLALREKIPVGAQVRADDELLRVNLSADIAQLEGELVWARYARERVTWLLSQQNAIWPSVHERSRATAQEASKRRDARTELFGRIAGREPPTPGEPKRGLDDGRASSPSQTAHPDATREVG